MVINVAGKRQGHSARRPMSHFRSLPAAGFTILPKATVKWLPQHAFLTPVGQRAPRGPDPETKCTDVSKKTQALSDLFPSLAAVVAGQGVASSDTANTFLLSNRAGVVRPPLADKRANEAG